MITVSLDKASTIKGERISVRIIACQGDDYEQLQLEVYEIGVLNPESKLGMGTTPRRPERHVHEVDIDTTNLPEGLFEIRLVRFHTPRVSGVPAEIDFLPVRDFDRQVFVIQGSGDQPLTLETPLSAAERLESEIEQRFISPRDIRVDAKLPAIEYCVLVFVKDLLIGTRIRFDHFEIVPSGSGLERRDSYDFINGFLQAKTSIKLAFNYDDVASNRARNDNPVCVVHFPCLQASNENEALDYCDHLTERLLFALSLTRDAAGEIFDIVVLNLTNGDARKYSINKPYRGNLLTGNLSGESPEALHRYIDGLALDDMNRFLVGLFKQAKAERSPDFQYVRYWQILETLAESQNYDPSEPLVDFEGQAMMDGSKERYKKGPINTVFNLLRENEIGDSVNTWKSVNIWYAFRNAVAHYGAIAKYENLSRNKEWARLGIEELQANPGHDSHLWTLKEDTKLLLMRRLVNASKNTTA